MINQYFNSLEAMIDSSPVILFYNLERMYGSSTEGYIKINVVFGDFSKLELSEFVEAESGKIRVAKYRYQYMNEKNELIFRYDNAPHCTKSKTFPEHKHLKENQAIDSYRPELNDLLGEIYMLIMQVKID